MEQLSIKQITGSKNLIVPEIQREYVWGLHSNQILEEFIKDIKLGILEYASYERLKKDELNKVVKELFDEKGIDSLQEIQKLKDNFHEEKTLDLGFLYSYKPNYSHSSKFEDLFLIDGQQRFTSLFLTWLYLSIKLEGKQSFLDEIRLTNNSNEIAFNYRVRNLTQDFIKRLILDSETIDDLLNFSDRTWFLNDFGNDVTIKSIGEAFSTIHRLCGEMDETDLHFITNRIKFWHFNTNATSQGEELYITMNSRGKAISDNENIRALLFEGIADKSQVIAWGKKWEVWQDLFWKRKSIAEGSNADRGFDSFLMCIAGMENYLSEKKSSFISQANYLSDKISIREIANSLDLETVEKYYEGLFKLHQFADQFTKSYTYSSWVQKSFDEIWSILNSKTNWFADYNDTNRTTEQRRMVYIWSILLYLAKSNDLEENIDDVFRVLRIYYLRFSNNVRSVNQIKKDVEGLFKEGVWKFQFNRDREEENLKHKALFDTDIRHIRAVEEMIWELEDHKYNLDGSDMNSINSSHLIDYKSPLNHTKLFHIKKKFFEVFKLADKELINMLITYGEFWQKVSPNYYSNFRFNNWRKTVRDDTFKSFFNDYLNFDGSVETFTVKRFETLKREYVADSTSLHDQLLFYVLNANRSKMWSEGYYIAIANENYCALHKLNGHKKDKFFPNSKKIFNTKGHLNGGNPNLLSSLITK